MANFDDQVMGLTGLTISGSSTAPSQADLATFLNDGVHDVTNRIVTQNPILANDFVRVTGELTGNDTTSLSGAKIIEVVREGTVDNEWIRCSYIPPGFQFKATDTDSLHYASEYSPVYTILENGIINVYPAPGSNPNTFKIYYVNNAPEEGDGTDLIHNSSTIKYFPSDKIYLVVIYAAIKSLESKMSEFTIDEEDSELVQMISQNLVTLKQQYETAFGASTPNKQAGA